jgi:hypothetical protein
MDSATTIVREWRDREVPAPTLKGGRLS